MGVDEMGEQPGSDSTGSAGPRRSTFTPATPESFLSFAAKVATDGARQSIPIDAPPPSPSSAVIPPPGSALPRPPQRKSLADLDLLSSLVYDQGADTLEAIEQLQQQLTLREQEAREFRSWELSMQAIGTPEALDVVEEARATFTEAIAIVPAEARMPSVQSEVESWPSASLVSEGAVTYDLVEPEETPRITGGADIPSLEWTLGVEPEPADAQTDTQEEQALDPEIALAGEIFAHRDHPIEADDGHPVVATAEETSKQQVFSPETSGSEPVPLHQRVGRSFRLFWLWFAANSSVVSVILGATLLALGMSLRQAVVATLVGVALSFLPLGVGTLASKWNGQPTLVVSRATFGLVGNILPALLALVTRLLWGAVLLWLLASITATILFGAGLGGGLNRVQLTIVIAGAAFLIALVVAFLGYALLARVQLVLSVLSGALIVMFIVVSWPLVDLQAALTVGDGPWTLVLTGAILVFSFVGLTWATASGDVARYQRPTGSGATAMLMAPFAAVLPSFLLIGYGSLLAASDRGLAVKFIMDPVQAMTSITPGWFTVPLMAAVGIGLLSGVILSIYSGGFAVVAIASRLRRDVAVLIAGTVLGAITIAMTLLAVSFTHIFRDLATTLAVPTIAWVGIFIAEVMIRNRKFNSRSLLHSGGIYPAARWLNLSMLIVATVVGFGLTSASVAWLSWQGYLLGVFGISPGSELAQADIGVIVALLLGLLTPIVAGIPAIRKQESERDAPAEAVGAPR